MDIKSGLLYCKLAKEFLNNIGIETLVSSSIALQAIVPDVTANKAK